MVVIRLARFGKRNAPKYRITVADRRRAHTGKYLEVVGSFNPHPGGNEKKIVLDLPKTKDWIAKGAQPTERVKSIIRMAEKGV